MLISIIIGTRPEIIKMAPVIRECEQSGLNYFVLHTGQHYSYNMDKVFFEQLGLSEAKYNLDVGSGSHGKQTGQMLIRIEQVLQKEKPDLVLVEGDTNTVLAGALAAVKLGIKVGHVEAGLRSYNRKMPEEINRILVDHSSDYLFAPTEKSREILLGEGISKEKVFVTGNTVVDAVFQNLELSKIKTTILNDLGLTSRNYFVVTLHRQENVDNIEKFCSIVEGLQAVRKKFKVKIIFPVHPRSKKSLKKFGLSLNGFNLVEPLDYLSFLQLENNAQLVITDSGGVQEESCVLGVPCVTLRDDTERPETVEVGSNLLAGTTPDKILKCSEIMLSKPVDWRNPYGDGNAAKALISKLSEL
ncbi:MAG: UDP-N-acetylglucosamine 2-epimerase (non-hydrolyzing) [Candidatus Bathyarchaeota archaeon]|nr:MAG: UDP-N-acetylglucosamine 2-epimerase (non-hydrolyzing) [Candidatus Bathyarchaeota archaeon]